MPAVKSAILVASREPPGIFVEVTPPELDDDTPPEREPAPDIPPVIKLGIISVYDLIPASENGITQTSGNGDVVSNFNCPVYGMLDFAQQVKQIVRDTARDGGFRGVLASG